MSDTRGPTQAEFERAAEEKLGPMALELDLDSFQAVWLLHQTALAARQHLERAVLVKHDLTWTQFEVLWHLWLFGEEELRFIARDVGLSKSATTNVTGVLESRGYLIRSPGVSDRRLVFFKISRKGIGLMKRVFPPFNHAEAEFSAGLDTGDKQQLSSLLRRLLEEGPRGVGPAAPLGRSTARARAGRGQPSR